MLDNVIPHLESYERGWLRRPGFPRETIRYEIGMGNGEEILVVNRGYSNGPSWQLLRTRNTKTLGHWTGDYLTAVDAIRALHLGFDSSDCFRTKA
jgi:hypothetical protein